MSVDTNGVERIKCVANCPHCEEPHHYVEIGFPIENDRGYWEVECLQCKRLFVIEINNPHESGGSGRLDIKSRIEGDFGGDRAHVAHNTLRHNIDLNRNSWRFNFSATPLYRCAIDSSDLEILAREALEAEISNVLSAYGAAVNYLLSSRGDHEFAVVRIAVECSCGENHTASFYSRLAMGTARGPRAADDFLLADISGAALEKHLDGIVTKNDAMDLLEKLIIRWNLLAKQILIVSPFVGTPYMSHEKQLVIWRWLLEMLDSRKSVFLTRGATYAAYKKAIELDGFSVDSLEQFGLQNALVAMDVRKQDFHAKFFAALSDTGCEVMSGSANLVRGPSVENISFRKLSAKDFDERYLKRMNLKAPLPAPKIAARQWVLIDIGPDGWRSLPFCDAPYV